MVPDSITLGSAENYDKVRHTDGAKAMGDENCDSKSVMLRW